MRWLLFVWLFAVCLGGLCGCSSNPPPSTGAYAPLPPQDSGEDKKALGKPRIPKPPK